jgi:LacI family transcriptional regulator
VFGGRPFRPEEHRNNYVDVDNGAGAALATERLIEIGRTRIATITGPPNMQVSIDRQDGWMSALTQAGLETHRLAHADFTMAGGAAAMRELLQNHPDIDGVFVASDLMATGAVSVLRSRGTRVPDDIAIVGFDNSSAATSGEIGLTTVHQPSREMGREMARMLLSLLRGEPTERELVMPTRLVVRDSA